MCGAYTEYTFGFPVRVLNAEMITIGGEPTPNVDYFALSNRVLESLAFKASRLSGDEVRFIRLAMEKSLSEFGREVGVRHSAVSKWESRHNRPTSMTWGIEVLIRMKAIAFLHGGLGVEIFDYLSSLEPDNMPSGDNPDLVVVDYSTCEPAWGPEFTETINIPEKPKPISLVDYGKYSDNPLATAA